MNLDWHYKLRGNENGTIDATASRSEGTDGCTPYDPDEENTGEAGHPAHASTCTGWTPVGDNTTPFTGSLEGAGYTINNLYINIRTTITHVGLFGQTSSSSVIQNVGMTNAFIKADVSLSRVGSLVGLNGGSISNSYATASVTASGSIANTGGLVGYNTGIISNSYATGSVTVTSGFSNTGGLVGYNTGITSNSYASASVSGGGYSSTIGGLVGWNTGSLSNSYTTALFSVTDASNPTVGGLLGTNEGRLSNSYATGSIPGSSNGGGLVGTNGSRVSYTGKNYFVYNAGGEDGVHTGFCGANAMDSPNVCIRAGEEGQSDDDRRMWLQDTLDESAADTADPPGLGWSDTNWENFVGAGVGYPKLLYAQVEGFCSDGSDKNESACEASGSCSVGGGTHMTADDCTTATPTAGVWTPNTWLAGGDECGGSTGVVCGARIPGQ